MLSLWDKGSYQKNFWHWNSLKDEREDQNKNQKNVLAIVSDDEEVVLLLDDDKNYEYVNNTHVE